MLELPLGIVWLSAVLLAPLDGRRRWVGWFAVIALFASFIATLWLGVDVLQNGPQVIVTGNWPIGVGITLRADALGTIFAALSQGVVLVSLLYEVIAGVSERFFPAVVLFVATGLTGLFLTGDAFNFYVFFEVSMTAAFVLTSYGQEQREIRAALIFTVVNLLGSTIFLCSIAGLYRVTGTLDMEVIEIWAVGVDPAAIMLIATLIFVAFSVKLGLFPFHFWLPLAYRDTRPAVAAILSGAIANIGSYGLLRFGADMLPRERAMGAMVLLILGTASVLYGAYQAIGSRSTAGVLAYSSISQAGYILVAIAVGGAVGYAAAVIYTIVNALNKTMLFLAIGLRGWLVGAAFAIGALSIAGVPPSIGFLSKMAVFRAGISTGSVLLLVLLFVGSAFGFIYMFQAYQRHFWTRQSEDSTSQPALRVLVFGLASLIVLSGLWPEPLLGAGQQVVETLLGE